MEKQFLEKAGEWTGRVKTPGKGWLGKTEKGTPFIRVPVLVDDGGSQVEAVWRGWLTDGAFDFTAKALAEALDWNGDLEALASGDVDWEGREVSITTAIETFEGKAMCKVQWLNRARGGAAQIDQDSITGLIQRFGRRGSAIARSVQAERRGEASATPRKVADGGGPSAEEIAEDDIPF